MQTKLTIGALLLVAIIVFGVLFWAQFFTGQEQLANSAPTVEAGY